MTTLGEWVRDTFGLGDGPVSVTAAARGADARTSLLRVGPDRYALKQPFGAVEEDDIRREAGHLDHFADAGIEVPVHLSDRTGRYVVAVPDELGGGQARVTRWVDGRVVGSGSNDLSGRLGALLGALHAAAPMSTGDVSAWYRTTPGAAVWHDLLARSDGQPWAAALAHRLPDLLAHARFVASARPPRGPLVVGHRDLHPDNVLVAPDGSLRAIDWEDCGPTDTHRELAKVLVQWHVEGAHVDEGGITATVEAYACAGGPGRVETIDDFTMVVCTETNFLAEQVRSALDPALTDERREHTLAEIEQGLTAYVPTPQALARVLAVASRR